MASTSQEQIFDRPGGGTLYNGPIASPSPPFRQSCPEQFPPLFPAVHLQPRLTVTNETPSSPRQVVWDLMLNSHQDLSKLGETVYSLYQQIPP